MTAGEAVLGFWSARPASLARSGVGFCFSGTVDPFGRSLVSGIELCGTLTSHVCSMVCAKYIPRSRGSRKYPFGCFNHVRDRRKTAGPR